MRHGNRKLLPGLLLAAGALAFQPSVAEADATFSKALASASKRDLTEWGRRYQHGEGVPRNVNNAIRLFCKAAKKGDTDAQFYLGWLYANGSGVRRDDELAAAWLHLAAAREHPQSKRVLSHLGYAKRPKRKPVCALSDLGKSAHLTSSRRAGALGFTRSSQAKGPIANLVRDLAGQYKLDANLVLAVVEVESNFNPTALSPKTAQGLMQLIPATAERFGVQNVWDPEQNLRGGMSYLRWLLDELGDVRLALAAYNAGEGAVRQHGGVPPYPETQDYVARVMRKISP
jgi:TPR repeat protein